MGNLEQEVINHYGEAELLIRILAGLEASGIDLKHLQVEDLAPVEEFHTGGRKATAYAVEKMKLDSTQHVLDVGCGIGGAARYIASQLGCRVSGIDLTPEYIASAKKLTAMTGLDKNVRFQVASALDMPFDDQYFDAAITLHVAMNIAERGLLYKEIARLIKPGGVFCLFDVMKKGDTAIVFPVPWAQTEETSHLATADEMRIYLEEAGFAIQEVEDRTDFAIDYFKESMAAAKTGPKPLGLHLVMGESAAEKINNVVSNLEGGRIAPVQIVATRLED